ncbi:MAG: cadherin-like domain-containing protein [Pirellulales bacterium]
MQTYHDQTLTVPDPGVVENDTIYASLQDVLLDSQPSLGQITDWDGLGGFTYVPNFHAYGTDTFTYHDVDKNGQSSNEATVTIDVIENAPTDTDQTYSILHDHVLTVAPAGVLTNATDPDPPDMGKLTASLVSGPSQGQLTDYIDGGGTDHPLLVDGSFVYTPPPHWAGTVTFQFDVSDGILSSGPYTVTINVTDQAPVANDDQYKTGWNKGDPLALQPLTVAPSGVQQNDMDPDPGDTFTSTVTVQPQHGTLSDYVDGSGVDHPLLVDGSFVYTPDVGFGGVDTFQYTDSDGVLTSKPATVTIMVQQVHLQIAEGYPSYKIVPDNISVSRGAFTVANINDTQGNGTQDTADSPVRPYGTFITSSAPGGGLSQGNSSASCGNTGGFNVGDTVAIFDSNPGYQKLQITAINPNVSVTFDGAFYRDYPAGANMKHYGRDEVDLMPLTIYPPSPILPGNYQEQVFVNGPATLWLDSVKQNKAGNGVIYTINDVRTLSASGLTLYVEAGQSQSMRDISIRLKYNGVSDVVKATGVWVTETDVETANKTATQVEAELPVDFKGTPTDAALVALSGTGVLPASPTSAQNCVVMEFTVEPLRVKADGSWDGTTWEQDGVNFDLSRQISGRTWYQVAGAWVEDTSTPGNNAQYPMVEEANGCVNGYRDRVHRLVEFPGICTRCI